ncbi:MAG TPA: glutathione-disulfide reductase, partial [Candidatus Binataceae bacterium]|nr:glutathione-disulfide reductase [Candidatus Binataceae bacterium]
GFGWTLGERSFDWSTLIANKDREIARLNGVYEKVLTDNGVRILRARATIADAHTVVVGSERHTARYILVATGGWPTTPPIPGGELAITSNEAFFLPQFPARAIIVGGGYIGLEFAGIFHGLGAKVSVVHRGALFLRGFDDDLRRALAAEMGKRGIELRFNRTVERIEKLPRGVRATLNDGAALEADLIMCATGRTPNTRNLGLKRAGVKLDHEGAVAVDAYSCSSVPNIYAVGDCTDRLQLTPVAIAEGQAVAETLFHANPKTPDYENVPTAVFSQPNLGTVGLTEAAARERYRAVDIYKSSFRPLKHTLSGRDEHSFMKLVVDRETDRVLGCHMVGTDAGEIVQGLAVALKCGATKAQFDATIGIHPTAAEEFVTMRNKS